MAEPEVTNPFEDAKNTFASDMAVPSPVVRTITDDALAEIDKQIEEAKDKHSFLDLLDTAIREEWVTGSIGQLVNRNNQHIYNPVKEMTPELLNSLTEGLADETAIQDIVDTAINSSLADANLLADDYRKTAANRQKLAEGGGMGTFATVLAATLDLPELGAIMATTALVPPAGGALGLKKAHSLSRAFKVGGTIGVVESGVGEYLRSQAKYDITGGDVALAMSMGGLFGGSINTMTSAFARKKRFHEVLKKESEGKVLTLDEIDFLEDVDGARAISGAIERAEAARAFDDVVDLDSARVFDTDADGKVTVATVTPEIAEQTPFQRGAFSSVRSVFSSSAKGLNSENSMTRWIFSKMGLNSAGNKPDPVTGKITPVATPASQYKLMQEGKYVLNFEQVHKPASKAWRKRTGGSQLEFNQLVSDAIRTGRRDYDPEVLKSADNVSKADRQLAQDNIDANAAGFTSDIFNRHKNYLPRLFSDEAIANIRRNFGNNAKTVVQRLVRQAIFNAQPDIVEEVTAALTRRLRKKPTQKQVDNYINAMIEGYSETVFTRPYIKGSPALSNEYDLEEIISAFKKAGIPDEDMEDVIRLMTRNKAVRGHKRTRFRVVLDEMAQIEAQRVDGEVVTVKFTDLLENDIEVVHNANIFQQSGAYGLAKVGVDTNEVGSSLEAIIAKINKEAGEKGLTGTTEEIKALQFMYDGITGKLGAKDASPEGLKVGMRRVRQFTYASVMGMAGMSALMEVIPTMMDYSFRTVLKNTPKFRDLVRRASDGQLENPILREFTQILGKGEEVLVASVTRATRFEADLEPSITRTTRVDELLGKVSKFVSISSGLLPITALLRRISILNYSQEWFEAATKRGRSPFSAIRKEQLGISDEMQDRIVAMMNDPVNGPTIDPDGGLRTMNVNKWADQEASEVFIMSMLREVTQQVQEVDIGSMNYMLRSSIGQTVFQFLSFPLAALEQQTMRLGVRAANGEAKAVTKLIMSSMLWGGLLYTARVQLNAAGRSDADEYIKRQMAPDRLLTGAIGQIGAASIFMLIFQTATGSMTGNNNAFTPPAIGLFNKGMGLVPRIGTGETSENELNTLFHLAPTAKVYGIHQSLNLLANQLAN